MKQQLIHATAHSTATPEQVWALLADVTTWKEWGRWREATIDQPGTNDPQGVGAIRRFQVGRNKTIERIVEVEAPRRFAYELISGVRVHSYKAVVTLTAAPGGGTDLVWDATFEGIFPGQGALIRVLLGRFIQDAARRLAAAAGASTTNPQRT